MFKFRLQPVLDHRKALEEVRQREYHDVVRQMSVLEEKLAGLVRQQAEGRRAVTAGVGTRHGAAMSQYYGNWSRWAGHEERRLQRVLKELEGLAEQRRVALTEAVKQRMMIEKLRERDEREYRREEDRREQKMFDELALREFAMTRREEKPAA